MLKYYLISKKEAANATEYFCLHCRQLRLSLHKDKSRCQHCGNMDLITGPVGSIDKDAQIRKLNGFTE